jgi:hypothetical protein
MDKTGVKALQRMFGKVAIRLQLLYLCIHIYEDGAGKICRPASPSHTQKE